VSAFANILVGGVFHAAVLFLVAAGLQLVFGVQKIINLACGSFYALGAYFGVTFIAYATQLGLSPWLIFPGLVIAGLLLGVVGPPIERMLRSVYGRDALRFCSPLRSSLCSRMFFASFGEPTHARSIMPT
jgi:branched-chain amino acid transport system permease protein